MQCWSASLFHKMSLSRYDNSRPVGVTVEMDVRLFLNLSNTTAWKCLSPAFPITTQKWQNLKIYLTLQLLHMYSLEVCVELACFIEQDKALPFTTSDAWAFVTQHLPLIHPLFSVLLILLQIYIHIHCILLIWPFHNIFLYFWDVWETLKPRE